MTTEGLPVVVMGAGVSGLTVAYRLHQAGRKVIVLEASSNAGGNIRTESRDGYLYDLGPDSFLKTKPEGVALCRDLGLESEMLSPREGASRVLVAKDGALFPMPEGLSLGVPKRPWPLLESSLLSGLGKARALLEPFIGRSSARGEESISEFTARRLGKEMAETLAAPLLAGVFAGDADRLSMEAAFPQLVELERKHGSLFSGMNGGKSIAQVLLEEATPASSPFVSLKRGLGQLIDALLLALPSGCVQFGARVAHVEATQSGACRVICAGEREAILAAHVVIAGPPWAAARVVSTLSEPLFSGLTRIRGFQTATVFFGFSEEQVHADLAGSGFIVPPGEGEILAGTFISSKWAERAPPGKVLVRAFLGGARRDIRTLPDEQLCDIASRELGRLLGSLGSPELTQVYRYERGSPQPELGHLQRLVQIQEDLARHPWLSLVGSGYDGVGIPDCIRQANAVAAKLLEQSP